jgi:medium-chain acyl-[acyl-carrier-protein] hydrolase
VKNSKFSLKTMKESLKFEKRYRVHVYETGPDGRLSLFAMFNYMQDIASEHAEKLGFGRNDLLKNNWFWVLSRMYVEIAECPAWEDTVSLRTWPNGTDRLFALRNYEMTFTDGRKALSASSSWLVLDMDTKKIQRPENLEFARDLPSPDGTTIRNPLKLEHAVEQGPTMHCFRIKASDLDINLHANNAAYLRWIYDSYDLGFLMENDPQSVEINYLAESKYGEEILIGTAAGGVGSFDHSIIRNGDGRELCRVNIKWKKAFKKIKNG